MRSVWRLIACRVSFAMSPCGVAVGKSVCAITAAIAVVLFEQYAVAQSFNIDTVVASGDVGKWSSISYNTNGNPEIAYCAPTGLMYARWTGKGWNVEKVTSCNGNCSLEIDENGTSHIAISQGGSLA